MIPGHLLSVFRRFTVLRGAVRELWVVFAVKLLGIVAYAMMNTTFALWLSSDLGYSDKNAGFIVAAWSTVMTLLTVFAGSFTDAIGVRRALLLGTGLCVASRAVLAFSTIPGVALVAGMLPLAVGEALGVPVLVAAIRRFSTTAQRSFSFALFYALMNGGFLIANLLFDRVRAVLGEPRGFFLVPLLGLRLSTYQTIFVISCAFEIATLLVVFFFVREGVEVTDEGVRLSPARVAGPARPWAAMVADTARETARIFAGLWGQAGFYRFLAFLGFAAFARLVVIHMYYTYPKFGIRELGEGAPVGGLSAVNSVVILLLVPVVGAITQRIPAFVMVRAGSVVAAASVFILAVPPQWFQPLADGWLGHQIADSWLGGDSRFSPDAVRDPRALAVRLETGPDAFTRQLRDSLTPVTRALLDREMAGDAAAFSPSSSPSTAWFAPADLVAADRFIARLKADADPVTGAFSRHLWDLVPAGAKTGLTATGATAEARAAGLAAALNQILRGPALSPASPQAQARLSPAARALAQTSVPALPNQDTLLNRVCLEDLYPAELPRSHHPARAALAWELTRRLAAGPLLDRPGAEAIQLSAPAREARDPHPAGRALVRLNRMILEDHFQGLLAEDRVGVAGSVSPYYVTILLFIVVFSLGEAIYSPRLYEYAAAIAPKGQEGSYMSLSYLPFFLAKLLVSGFSGLLLARYCPEAGPRHSETLWLIIGITTLIAPAGLILFSRQLRVPEPGREG